MCAMAGRIRVGTSSWADPGFVKEWYPRGMAAKERLPWYARHFDMVELNSSFYAIPDRNTVHGWVEITPENFTFDVKAHRALSRHSAALDSLPPDMREGVSSGPRGRVVLTPELELALVRRLLEETAPLAEAGKLGAYLLQMTPAFAPGKNRLEELGGLVEAFAPQRLAIELRHRGWVREKRRHETLAWFADLAYMRLHGRNTDGYLNGKSVAERFGWRYTDDELEQVRERALGMAEQAGEVHVAFNNNRDDDAPTAAQRFRSLLGQVPPPEEQLTL